MTCPAYDIYRKSACQWCADGLSQFDATPFLTGIVHQKRAHITDPSKFEWCSALTESDWAQREHERCQKLEKALRRIVPVAIDSKHENFSTLDGVEDTRTAAVIFAREALAELKETK